LRLLPPLKLLPLLRLLTLLILPSEKYNILRFYLDSLSWKGISLNWKHLAATFGTVSSRVGSETASGIR